MKSREATVHIVADLVQGLKADTEAGTIREDKPPIVYEEGSRELAQFDALLADDSEHGGGAGTLFNGAVDAVDYDIHLAQFSSSMNSCHSFDGKQVIRPGGEAW